MRESIFLLSFWALFFFSCQNSAPQLPPAFYKSIGNQIRTIRIEKGMTQQALADSVGITQNGLSLIEDGLATPIHTKLVDIENFLNTTFVIDGEQISIEHYLENK